MPIIITKPKRTWQTAILVALNSGPVLIVDDVITAGTAIRGVLQFSQTTSSADQPANMVMKLDKTAKNNGQFSASQSFSHDHKLPVLSIVTIEDLLEFLDRDRPTDEALISTGAGKMSLLAALRSIHK